MNISRKSPEVGQCDLASPGIGCGLTVLILVVTAAAAEVEPYSSMPEPQKLGGESGQVPRNPAVDASMVFRSSVDGQREAGKLLALTFLPPVPYFPGPMS